MFSKKLVKIPFLWVIYYLMINSLYLELLILKLRIQTGASKPFETIAKSASSNKCKITDMEERVAGRTS